MIEIIPTIIAKDFQELQEKIKKVEPYVDWIQLDVMDGKFVPNATWNNPEDLKKLPTKTKFEVHLMIIKPEEKIDQWKKSGVKRIIFHFESTKHSEEIIRKIKKAGLEAGIAINPQTSIEVLDPFLEVANFGLGEGQINLANLIDLVLIMTVQPGQGGQRLLEETLPKIKSLRAKYSDVKIEVDGGINLETAPKVIQAGANILAAGSAIFKSNNIRQTIEAFKNL